MTPDPLLLFPLAALALVVLYPALWRNGDVPSSPGSRARRRQLLGRAAVITLPVAAALSEIRPLWPAPYLGRAFQALLLFAIVMLPLVIAHVVVTRRQRQRSPVRGAVATASDASRRLAALLGGPASARAAKKAANAQLGEPEPTSEGWNLTALRSGEADDPPDGPAPGEDERKEEREATPTDPEPASAPQAVPPELRGMRGHEIVELVQTLRADRSRLRELVVTLRTDRSRLRELVITQRTAHASACRARERAHAVARDAIGVMQQARASQKLAEKAVRHERRERLRAEARYERAARNLKNAASIIRSGRHLHADGAAKRKRVRPDAGGEVDRTLETH